MFTLSWFAVIYNNRTNRIISFSSLATAILSVREQVANSTHPLGLVTGRKVFLGGIVQVSPNRETAFFKETLENASRRIKGGQARQCVPLALASSCDRKWCTFHYAKDSCNFGRLSNGKVGFRFVPTGIFGTTSGGDPLWSVGPIIVKFSFPSEEPFHRPSLQWIWPKWWIRERNTPIPLGWPCLNGKSRSIFHFCK